MTHDINLEDIEDAYASLQARQLATTRATPMSPDDLFDLREEMRVALCDEHNMTPGLSEGLTLVLRLLATLDQRDNRIQVAEL